MKENGSMDGMLYVCLFSKNNYLPLICRNLENFCPLFFLVLIRFLVFWQGKCGICSYQFNLEKVFWFKYSLLIVRCGKCEILRGKHLL